MSLITHIRIEGLNGDKHVDIPIPNRHCVLVGPNGSGKSTALLIIAYALGRQWKRLGDLRFERVSFTFENGQTATLTKSSCVNFLRSSSHPRFSRIQRTLLDLGVLESFFAADIADLNVARQYAELTGAPTSDLRMMHRQLRMADSNRSSQKEVADFQKSLDAASVPPTIYLPTYRRIELELNRLLEHLGEIRRYVGTESDTSPSNEFIVELVKFGMEDVSTAVQSFERHTRDFARNRFNRMMTSYLKEMANAKSLSVRDVRALNINKSTIDLVLSRIEEGLLNEDEKNGIADIILELSSGSGAGNPPFNKKWLAHFFVRLLEVHRDIVSRESPVTSLVDALNRYFYPKTVSYDIESYHFSIRGEDGDELALGDLSSGEKQLVSVLSHLYFSKYPRVNILIDEPELSLSVPWQSDFLPDIAGTPACNQIFAVTHSPFIYENKLQNTVVDFVEMQGN